MNQQSLKPQHPAADRPPRLPGTRALALLNDLPDWGNVVTIVLHGGCVFEFKGPFPAGTLGRGFLNLDGPVPGFHGHLKLDAIDHIGFQDRPHAGRVAYALTFNNAAGENLFKVFLGRDEQGNHFPEQLSRFDALRDQAKEDWA
jgi:hypothetical protein